MKLFTRVISIVLLIAMSVNFVLPAAAAESNEDFCVYEAVVDTTARVKPYQDSAIQSKIKRGDLVFSTKSVTNSYGNTWIQTVDPSSGETGFVFVDKLSPHQCELHPVDGSETLLYCRCGAFVEEEKDGINRIGAAVALPRPALTPDVIAELGYALKGAITAALPYVGVAVVCGTVVYIAVTVSQTVTVEDVSTDWRKLDKEFRPEDGVFYNGIVKGDDNLFYIDIAHPMDEYDAVRQIDKEIAISTLGLRNFCWFVYTVQDYDALNLVDRYISTRSGFTCDYSVDSHGSSSQLKQFKHYHITNVFNHYYYPDGWEEHYGGHVAFGSPALDSMWGQGAWF